MDWEGRRYTPGSQNWDSEESTSIAREQIQQENLLARRANRIVVADTDALATHVWHRRYLGFYSDDVWSLARRQSHDLYLLTSPDFPFVQDGTREGETVRDAMHLWFIEALERAGRRHVVVDGTPAHRMARAIAAIEPLLQFEPMPASRMPAGKAGTISICSLRLRADPAGGRWFLPLLIAGAHR